MFIAKQGGGGTKKNTDSISVISVTLRERRHYHLWTHTHVCCAKTLGGSGAAGLSDAQHPRCGDQEADPRAGARPGAGHLASSQGSAAAQCPRDHERVWEKGALVSLRPISPSRCSVTGVTRQVRLPASRQPSQTTHFLSGFTADTQRPGARTTGAQSQPPAEAPPSA